MKQGCRDPPPAAVSVWDQTKALLQNATTRLCSGGAGEKSCSEDGNHLLSAHNRRGLLFGWGRLFPPTFHHMALC